MSSGCYVGPTTHSRVYTLQLLWSMDADCLPHRADHYHFARDLPFDAPCPPMPQSAMLTVSSSLSTRGRRPMGLTAWRVWSGCDCPGWCPTLRFPSERP